MSKPILDAKALHDEASAYAWMEARLWPNGPVCPHCGGSERISKMKGKSTRIGAYKCYHCRKPFTVKIGTIFEDSHVPMRYWVQAIYLMCASKKGISTNELHRTLGVTLKTAWFMSHRIREAMRESSLAPMGGYGDIVEVDETVFGKTEDAPKKGKALQGRSSFRNAVLTLVERGGAARSFHIDGTSIANLKPVIKANLSREAKLMTDEWTVYKDIGREFVAHHTVNHKYDEYVRYQDGIMVTTNTVEGYFSIFKRGMKGIYQHCSEKHLHRYLAEFDFRYSNRIRLGINDVERTERLVKAAVGKRLTYQTPHH
jgi:transposase-like protein